MPMRWSSIIDKLKHARLAFTLSASSLWRELRKRFIPTGENALQLAAHIMVLGAMIFFIFNQRDVGTLWFSLGLLALATMFVLNMVLGDLETALGMQRADWLHLGVNGLLWFILVWITGLSDSTRFSFVPYLIFVLTAQAFVMLTTPQASLYLLGLIASWVSALLLVGIALDAILLNLFFLSTGLIFVIVVSTVLNLYRQQTERAEALLDQLRAANVELEASRRRDYDLAVAEERVRLARDIHDGLGHHLTALNLQLQAAARLIERDPARAAAAIQTSRTVAQAALDEVRQSVAAMRQKPLASESLPASLEQLATTFGQHTGLQTSLELQGEPCELPATMLQTLYRAVQEGLTNAQRHGAATMVQLQLAYEPDQVCLKLVDNGHGSNATTGSGFGLAGIRERVEQLGGHLHAGPEAEGGFVLTIHLPMKREEQPR
ncbi:MAG: sensor histidine kinase [Chloroflexia bacterium]|nr:sensor histidine kinase [Chloroflexia bacterium]